MSSYNRNIFFKNKENIELLKSQCKKYIDSEEYSLHSIEIFDIDNPDEIEFCTIRSIESMSKEYKITDFEYDESTKTVALWSICVDKVIVDKAVSDLGVDEIEILTELELDSIKKYGFSGSFMFNCEYYLKFIPII